MSMPGFSTLTSIILAGGLGSRLRDILPDRPKVLAEFHGRPFLTYLLDQLAAAGTRRVVLCTGYRAASVQACLGDTYGSVKLIYSPEAAPLGTGGALRLALVHLESDPVLVMNGDSLAEVDLLAYLAWFQERTALASLLLVPAEDTSRFGRVEVAEDGAITGFREKGISGPGWISAGVYFFKKTVLELIPPHQAYSLEQDLFPRLIGKGLYGYRVKGNFIDIGTPESYARAGEFLSRFTAF
jgi:D-glycero-alpha-D-manno-heptose 1-phosphate guanylyltransferase